jgi:hypothetical protein
VSACDHWSAGAHPVGPKAVWRSQDVGSASDTLGYLASSLRARPEPWGATGLGAARARACATKPNPTSAARALQLRGSPWEKSPVAHASGLPPSSRQPTELRTALHVASVIPRPVSEVAHVQAPDRRGQRQYTGVGGEHSPAAQRVLSWTRQCFGALPYAMRGRYPSPEFRSSRKRMAFNRNGCAESSTCLG